MVVIDIAYKISLPYINVVLEFNCFDTAYIRFIIPKFINKNYLVPLMSFILNMGKNCNIVNFLYSSNVRLQYCNLPGCLPGSILLRYCGYQYILLPQEKLIVISCCYSDKPQYNFINHGDSK